MMFFWWSVWCSVRHSRIFPFGIEKFLIYYIQIWILLIAYLNVVKFQVLIWFILGHIIPKESLKNILINFKYRTVLTINIDIGIRGRSVLLLISNVYCNLFLISSWVYVSVKLFNDFLNDSMFPISLK